LIAPLPPFLLPSLLCENLWVLVSPQSFSVQVWIQSQENKSDKFGYNLRRIKVISLKKKLVRAERGEVGGREGREGGGEGSIWKKWMDKGVGFGQWSMVSEGGHRIREEKF
jgi:hypothetical protein